MDRAIAIDRVGLRRALRDVGNYLAELRYIDLALRHIVDRNHRFAETGSGGYQYTQVQLGTRYPFLSPALIIPAGVSTEVELTAFAGLAERASQWAAAEMTSLNQRVQEIMHYPIYGYEPLDSQLQSVWETLNIWVEEDFGYLEDNLAHWEGPAASEFKSLFYNRFADARDNQQFLVRTLQGALEVSRRAVEYSQQGVINAIASAREALLEQLRLRSAGDVNTTSAKAALLVVAAGFTVFAAVTGVARPLWAIALNGGSFAASTAASELPKDGTENRDIEGGSADQLSNSLMDAIREVDIFLGKELDFLHDDLRRTRAQVLALEAAHLILPKRPAIADGGVRGEEFYHTSSERYP